MDKIRDYRSNRCVLVIECYVHGSGRYCSRVDSMLPLKQISGSDVIYERIDWQAEDKLIKYWPIQMHHCLPASSEIFCYSKVSQSSVPQIRRIATAVILQQRVNPQRNVAFIEKQRSVCTVQRLLSIERNDGSFRIFKFHSFSFACQSFNIIHKLVT